MIPATIKDFRAQLDTSLAAAGFTPRRRGRGVAAQTVWELPGDEVVPGFRAHTLRRPWGFRLGGWIEVELPHLRAWLDTHRPHEPRGLFADCFLSLHIGNERPLASFDAEFGQPVPMDDWVNTLKQRLQLLPAELWQLVLDYEASAEELGGLGSRHMTAEWLFLTRWSHEPASAPPIPQAAAYRIPPRYRTGESVRVGDRVRTHNKLVGRVYGVLDADEYPPEFATADWSRDVTGIFVENEGGGLIKYSRYMIEHTTELLV